MSSCGFAARLIWNFLLLCFFRTTALASSIRSTAIFSRAFASASATCDAFVLRLVERQNQRSPLSSSPFTTSVMDSRSSSSSSQTRLLWRIRSSKTSARRYLRMALSALSSECAFQLRSRANQSSLFIVERVAVTLRRWDVALRFEASASARPARARSSWTTWSTRTRSITKRFVRRLSTGSQKTLRKLETQAQTLNSSGQCFIRTRYLRSY